MVKKGNKRNLAKYRRGMGHDTWHWCTNCSTCPTSDYEEREFPGRPPVGGLCNECLTKERGGFCAPLAAHMIRDHEEEESIISLAQKGLDRILGLSQSQLISVKLQSFNILLFTFITAISITFYLGGIANADLAFLFVLGVSYLFSLIISIGYGYILEIVTNISAYKIESLRIGIMILFISLSLGISALIFNNTIINTFSLVLILIQLGIIALSGVFTFKEVVEDDEIESSQLWSALGKISTLMGILSFIVNIVLILYGFT